MNSKIRFLYMLTFLTVLAAVAAISISFYNKNHFRCIALTEVDYKSQKMNIISHYVFDGNVGSLVVEGELSKKDGEIFPFIIKNIFDFKRSGDVFYLKSKDIVSQPDDLGKTGYLNEYLSQFFYQNNKSIVFRFSEEYSNAYIVYLGGFPVGFCKK